MLKFCLGLGCGAILAGSAILFGGSAQAVPGAAAYDVRVVAQPGPFNHEATDLAADGYEVRAAAASSAGGLYIVMQKRTR